MTLPPERITVKRRRDEDPVEALYIQSKKQRPGIYWKLQSRLDGQNQSNQKPPAEGTRQDAPILINNDIASSALLPKPNNVGTPTESQESSAGNGQSISSNASRGGRAADGGIKGPKASITRKYHLTHDYYPSLKRQPSFSHGVHKRRRFQRDHLAIFVESKRGEDLIQRTIEDRSEASQDKIEDYEKKKPSGDSTLRRRPNVNAAERAWRSETWSKRNTVHGESDPEKKNEPATSWDAESMHIVQELQQIAIDQSRAAPQLPSATTLKFKPRPPGPRRTTEIATAENVILTPSTGSNLDEDGDYIIDTYIQAQLQTADVELHFGNSLDPLDNMDTGKVGILVIEEDQERLWEDFGDEDHSEVECESDEEDENAEDYYGNDYPEDEVDAEDEYGRGSYNYRIHASDDEEYGDDEPEWSDAENKS